MHELIQYWCMILTWGNADCYTGSNAKTNIRVTLKLIQELRWDWLTHELMQNLKQQDVK